MYSYIIGIIAQKEEGKIILENNGIGYEINVSNQTLNFFAYDNEPVKIFTYLVVREDEFSLYGFSTIEEKNLFLQLITVSGIGPKMAIGILSGLSLSDLTVAIINEDVKLLSKIKGLGKKTAERLCLELKDKLSPVGLAQNNIFNVDYDEDAVQMATDTLISLGISKNDAYMLARANASENATAEEIISKALRGYKG